MELVESSGGYINGEILKITDMPEELCNYIEMLYYENTMYKSVLPSIIEASNKYQFEEDSNDKFNIFMDRFIEAGDLFNIAMAEIKEWYLEKNPSLNHIKGNIDIGVNFSDLKCYATYKGKNTKHSQTCLGGCGQ